jgi:hypothetical protein
MKGFTINDTSLKVIERLWFLQWEYRPVVLYVAHSYSVLIRSVSQHVGGDFFLRSWYLMDVFKRSHYILFLYPFHFNATHSSAYRFSSNTFHRALHLQSYSALPICHVFRHDNIGWGVLIVKFFTFQLSPFSYNFLSFRSKYYPQQPELYNVSQYINPVQTVVLCV